MLAVMKASHGEFSPWLVQLFIAVFILEFVLYFSSSQPSEDYLVGGVEVRWKVAATTLLVPLLIQYALDEVAWKTHSSAPPTVKTDSSGHLFILVSLFPSCCLIGSALVINIPARAVLTSVGQVIAAYGILRKVQSFPCEVLGSTRSARCFYVFALAEALAVWAGPARPLAITAALLCKVAVLVLAAPAFKLARDVAESFTSVGVTLMDDRYVCAVLLGALGVLAAGGVIETARSLLLPLDEAQRLGERVMWHVLGVAVALILPGRSTRRGLAAFDDSQEMRKEMGHKKTFVRYISHEVRSPLSTTSLGLDCVQEILQSSAPLVRTELVELISDCQSTCTVAIQTLSDLLLYDKIESNMMQLERSDVECMDFIQKCCRPMEMQMKFSHLSWSMATTSRISRASIYADEHKMEQVLRNFLTNAIKFTPAGGAITLRASVRSAQGHDINFSPRHATGNHELPSPDAVPDHTDGSTPRVFFPPAGSFATHPPPESVRPSTGSSGRDSASSPEEIWFRCEITDTGPGITAENQEKLFGQYVQFDASKLQKGGGSGLGLWLSRAIVEAHGGVVGVKSRGLGHGSTFFFEIPAHRTIDSPSATPIQHSDEMFEVEEDELEGFTPAAAEQEQTGVGSLSLSPIPELHPTVAPENPNPGIAFHDDNTLRSALDDSSYRSRSSTLSSDTVDPALPVDEDTLGVASQQPPDDSRTASGYLTTISGDTECCMSSSGKFPLPSPLHLPLATLKSLDCTLPASPLAESAGRAGGMGTRGGVSSASTSMSTNTISSVGVGVVAGAAAGSAGSGSSVAGGRISRTTTGGPAILVTHSSSTSTSTSANVSSASMSRSVVVDILIADDAALTRKLVERMITNASVHWTVKRERPTMQHQSSNEKLDAATASNTIANAAAGYPSAPSSPLKAAAIDYHMVLSTSGDVQAKTYRSSAPPILSPSSRHGVLRTEGLTRTSSGSSPSAMRVDFVRPPIARIDSRERIVSAHTALTPTISTSSSHDGSLQTRSSHADSSSGSERISDKITVHIDHAANGQIAVDKVTESMLPWRKPFDIVVIDYFMPVLDGPQAIQLMRAQGFEGLIVAVTASTSKDDQDNLLRAGATAVMLKPFDVKVFQSIVAHNRPKLRWKL